MLAPEAAMVELVRLRPASVRSGMCTGRSRFEFSGGGVSLIA